LYCCFSGLLIDFDLPDAVARVLVADDIDATSMRFAARQRARCAMGKSIFRALDHIRFSALRGPFPVRCLSVAPNSTAMAVELTRVPKKFTDLRASQIPTEKKSFTRTRTRAHRTR